MKRNQKQQEIQAAAKYAYEYARERWARNVAEGQSTECVIESTDIFDALSDLGLPCNETTERDVDAALGSLGFYKQAAEAFKTYQAARLANGAKINLPDKLYHATYGPLLTSIQNNGLAGVGCLKNWEDSKDGVVYLALAPEVAESYAEAADNVPDEWLEAIVVLAIPVSRLDLTRLTLDSNVQNNSGDTLEYSGIIPWSAIEVI